jgi:chromosome segregation ATPase
MSEVLKKHRGSIEWHDGREPAVETYDYYLAAEIEATVGTLQRRIAELEAADEIHLQMHDTARQQLTTLQARVQAFLDHDAAQRERIAELEQALRLHLAVSPDDPVLITPVEQQLTTARRDALEVAAKYLDDHKSMPPHIGPLWNAGWTEAAIAFASWCRAQAAKEEA